MAVTLPLHACYTTVTRPFGQFDVNFTFTVNLQCNENVKALGEFTRKSRTLCTHCAPEGGGEARAGGAAI